MRVGRALAVAIAILAAAVFLFWAGPKLAPQVLAFLDAVAAMGVWAPIVFVLGYAVATVAFVPGSLLTMAGGLIFGLGWGTLWVYLGATLGSTLAFLISRFLARGAIEKRLAGNAKFAGIDKAVGKEGLKIVILLRLVPFFPFIWLNYGLGLTKVRFRDFLLGSVGMLPGTFLYVYYGKAIGSLAALTQGTKEVRGTEHWVFFGLGLLAAVAVTTVITRIARKALAAATENAAENTANEEAQHG